MADFFWFSDQQWARIEWFLPEDARGMPRVDDRGWAHGSWSMRLGMGPALKDIALDCEAAFSV